MTYNEETLSHYGIEKQAAKDPADVARDLIDSWSFARNMLSLHMKNLDKAFKSAQQNLKGLDRFGSGAIEAPTFLADLYPKVKSLSEFAADMQDQCQQVLRSNGKRV